MGPNGTTYHLVLKKDDHAGHQFTTEAVVSIDDCPVDRFSFQSLAIAYGIAEQMGTTLQNTSVSINIVSTIPAQYSHHLVFSSLMHTRSHGTTAP
jgi:hypothetical protein